jgi:hypothetical protein
MMSISKLSLKVTKLSSKLTKVGHKKKPHQSEAFQYCVKTKNYFAFLAYLLLNLSIRPAVSISLDLPV